MSASGRKRTLISVVLVVPERPLSGKAVIAGLSQPSTKRGRTIGSKADLFGCYGEPVSRIQVSTLESNKADCSYWGW